MKRVPNFPQPRYPIISDIIFVVWSSALSLSTMSTFKVGFFYSVLKKVLVENMSVVIEILASSKSKRITQKHTKLLMVLCLFCIVLQLLWGLHSIFYKIPNWTNYLYKTNDTFTSMRRIVDVSLCFVAVSQKMRPIL